MEVTHVTWKSHIVMVLRASGRGIFYRAALVDNLNLCPFISGATTQPFFFYFGYGTRQTARDVEWRDAVSHSVSLP